jgi:hypothetical protein
MPFCGPPPLLQGEDPTAYNDLLARVSGQLKPSDIIEEIVVREITDLIWESLRWRRDLVGFLNAILPEVLQQILQPLLEAAGPAPARSFVGRIEAAAKAANGDPELVYRWARGDQTAIDRVNALLASANLTMEHVRARAAAKNLDTIERFNRLIASTEARRNAALREIERRRAVFAQGLRQQVEQIEEAVMDEHADCAVQPALPGTVTAPAIEAVATVKAAQDTPPAELTKVTLAIAGPTATMALGDVVGARGPTGASSSSLH